MLATLSHPRLLRLYFPASLGEKPFCFCEVRVQQCSSHYFYANASLVYNFNGSKKVRETLWRRFCFV